MIDGLIEGIFGLISGLVQLIAGLFEMLFTGLIEGGGSGRGLGILALVFAAIFATPMVLGFVGSLSAESPDWILGWSFSATALAIFFALTCFFLLAYIALNELFDWGTTKALKTAVRQRSRAVEDKQTDAPILEGKSHGWVVFFAIALLILGTVFISATQIERKSARELRCEAIAQSTTEKVGARSERLGKLAEKLLREEGWVHRFCAGHADK
ncbi:MAG: hypothetical protein AAGD04_12685 [Pseudomonadota bacterium]